MPTRRIFELIVVTSILMRPAFGVMHLWAARIMGTTPESNPLHGVAEVVTVLV